MCCYFGFSNWYIGKWYVIGVSRKQSNCNHTEFGNYTGNKTYF